ncbi:MAG: AMP-binding protein [Chloroflexota bacterium]|jgi:acyl-coenzyme A synthetase/AMP-(fatty) acid ligase
MSFLDLRPTDAPALVDATDRSTTSFRQLLEDAGRVQRTLPDDKRLVFLRSRNDRFTATTYLATQLGGHALALLDGTKPLASQADTLARYRPDVVAGPEGTAAELADLGMVPGEVHRQSGGELVSMDPGAEDRLHADLALLLGTSGTTGSSKYVRLSQRNIEANARAIAEYIGIEPRDRPITSLPLHYSFGLSVLNSHWLAGAAVVLTSESVVQGSFWTTVTEHRCTSLAGVPYTYQLLERVGYRDMDLPSVDTMQQAGGALDRSLTQRYSEHMGAKGGRLFVMYGQTEATARIAYVPPERLPEKLGSAGRAIPGGTLRIDGAGSSSNDRPASGEVIYEGPNVMMGYATQRADLAAGDELGGVLRTGDIGYLDDDGYLFLTGRSKRIAKVFGLRINLDEVELMLREHGPAAVVAGDESLRGFCGFGTDDSVLELKSSLSRRLQLHPSALDLRRVDSLPVTSSGKIDYREVERWVRDGA